MKVSIIIPLYNGKQFITQTLQSCHEQDYEDLEVILIDDCSNDGGYELAREQMAKYNCPSRFFWYNNEENSGSLVSCNNGAHKASGEWLLFLGHDDILPSDYLSTIVKYCKESISFVHTCPLIINDKGEVYDSYHINEEIYNDTHRLKCSLTIV